jgi:hypothetical protein
MSNHKVGDLVMGINIHNKRILGVIKKIKREGRQLLFQVEWTSHDEWYYEHNINAFLLILKKYMSEREANANARA